LKTACSFETTIDEAISRHKSYYNNDISIIELSSNQVE